MSDLEKVLISDSEWEYFLSLFSAFTKANNLSPADSKYVDLREDYNLLLREYLEINSQLNLSSIRTFSEALRKHLFDSLLLLQLNFVSGEKILDLGTGGGFPGVPLGLFFRSITFPAHFVLLDSIAKKINAIASYSACEDTNYFSLVNGRGELYLQKFSVDTVLMRAVAPPERAIPWISNKARRWVVFAGPNNRSAWLDASPLLLKRGFSLSKEFSMPLYGDSEPRFLLEYRLN